MTIILDVLLGFAFLLCGIGLAVFMINGEMLESRYLIGIQNIFPKSYGYSFYLACWAMLVLLFALIKQLLKKSSNLKKNMNDVQVTPGAITILPSGDNFVISIVNNTNFLYVFRARISNASNYTLMPSIGFAGRNTTTNINVLRHSGEPSTDRMIICFARTTTFAVNDIQMAQELLPPDDNGAFFRIVEVDATEEEDI
ncbi:hypothetical protein ACQ4LE_010802 [Meloidogyne hapla]